MIDVVPELLEKIKKDFKNRYDESSKVKTVLELVENGKATYKDANEYAVEVGQILAKSFNINISSSSLPDEKMYFNIADRILNDTLGNNHKLIVGATEQIQDSLNKAAGIGIKGIPAPLNKDRIDGLINRLASAEKFEDIAWILNEPIVTFSQSVVEETMKLNVDFHGKSGLTPKVVRIPERSACEWCREVAGIYTYPDVPEDVYRRHDRCRCIVEYNTNAGKRQDVWSKKWSTSTRTY